MPWTKDTTSAPPRTIYWAPPEVWPTVRVIHDPEADYPWSVVYARLNEEHISGDLKSDVEGVMGL